MISPCSRFAKVSVVLVMPYALNWMSPLGMGRSLAAFGASECYFFGWGGFSNLRLFQHTFGTHPEQPLPTGYKPGFLSYLANGGLPNACAISGCVVIFLEAND